MQNGTNKTIMVQHMGRIYVGKPQMEVLKAGDEPGEEATEMLVAITDAYEVYPITSLIQDPTTSKMATMSTNHLSKIGTIVSIPEDAVVAELSSDSPYYKDYVSSTTGVRAVPANQIPPFKRQAH